MFSTFTGISSETGTAAETKAETLADTVTGAAAEKRAETLADTVTGAAAETKAETLADTKAGTSKSIQASIDIKASRNIKANIKASRDIKIGKRIAGLRTSRRMTQDSLAQKMNCSTDYIKRVESGAISVGPAFLVKAGELFDCSMDYLINGGEAAPVPENLPPAIEFSRSKEERIENEKELLAAYMCMLSNLHRDVITVPSSTPPSDFFDK